MSHSPRTSDQLDRLAAGLGFEQVAQEQLRALQLDGGRNASAHPVKNALGAVNLKAKKARNLRRAAKALDQCCVRV